MFMINKPFLQAFSATCDSRSITHRYTRWKNKRHVLKGLLVKIDPRNVPPIRALHVDANAAVPAEDIVQCLRATLHHLSWRIPNADFQGPPSQDNDFYGMTDTILKLFWSSDRAPNLETLRLCCGMRDILSSNPRYQWEMGHLVAALSFDLPRFQKLKHFEIHYSGGDNFLRNQLIESLPHGLQRLYISDVTITIQQLVSQVRERYFLSAQHTGPRMPVLPPNLMVDDGYDDVSGKPKIDSMPLHELPTADSIKISGRDQVQYLIAANTSPSDYDTNIFVKRSQCAQHDYLDDYAMRGESKFRRDEIPLNTGKLGFVTFEYDDLEWRLDGPVCVSDYVEESDRTRIFRLNGQLLDREHNLHLANDQATKEEYGIKPRQLGPGVDKEYHGNDVLSETDTYSRHPTIYAAIYNNAELAPKPHVIEQSLKELVACPQLGGNKEECDSMAWYFGNEAEAVKVFEQEPVAKAENQKQKPMLAEVEVRPSTRCRWMCPDFEIPPVGSFPVPTPPSDWKDLVRARWY
ncbi:hypothetical protein PMZ80_010601 [Knufia obscura]|nr:hypothetical protein PMZ80_010601 [Knufia obscura]